jgi:hypothetical protein
LSRRFRIPPDSPHLPPPTPVPSLFWSMHQSTPHLRVRGPREHLASLLCLFSPFTSIHSTIRFAHFAHLPNGLPLPPVPNLLCPPLFTTLIHFWVSPNPSDPQPKRISFFLSSFFLTNH